MKKKILIIALLVTIFVFVVIIEVLHFQNIQKESNNLMTQVEKLSTTQTVV